MNVLKGKPNNTGNSGGKGLSIRAMDYVMAGVTLLISVLLLYATYKADRGYNALRNETISYFQWQQEANMLQEGSDYLTEQVRCFVETGEREFLDNYFEEAETTRRRDRALEGLRERFGGDESYLALERAMAQSVSLMEREYYAMRLVIAARGYDLGEFPKALRGTELSAQDAALSPEAQEALAREFVYGQEYRAQKAMITGNTQACLSALSATVDREQAETTEALDRLLTRQRALIFVLIGVTILMMLLTLLLVVSPLLRAVVYVRADKPIPIIGSKEFRFLARTYNLMYEANREKKEQLAFKATHDALTGVYNRSGYDFLMENVDLSTSALLVLDVDKFKHFNDTYGHEMGDRVLKRVAATIRESFRSQDYVCRIGGDEFAVILVHTGKMSAELIRQKIGNVNAQLLAPEDGMPAVSISCGVAFGAEDTDADALFRTADAALYRVKNSGGSSCEVCQ